jgi:large subunit ribosomal protein L10
MTKEEKYKLVNELTEVLKQHPNFMVLDTGGMSVEKINRFRRACFQSKLKVQVVKNTLLKKALQNFGDNYEAVYPVLKQNTTVVFANENLAEPAKVLKDFRKEDEMPRFKAAFIENSFYYGESNLDAVASIKSKQEVLGEVISLLQSPISNLLGALQSSGGTIHGLLKTIEEKNQ